MSLGIEKIARLVGLSAAGALAAVSVPSLSADPQGHYTVTISKMRYGTLPSSLKVGDTITWVNKDTVLHTVTARDRSFDIRIAPGRQANMTLTKSGKFSFYCIIHPAMRGTLTVSAK